MGATAAVLEGLTEAVTRDTGYAVGSPLYAALFSADPGATGLHELASAPYARQAVSFGTTPGGGVDENSGPVSWSCAPGDVAYWYGFFSAPTAGTFLGGFPLVGPPLLAVASSVDSPTLVRCPGHGLAVGNVVRLFAEPGVPSSAVPAGYARDTQYAVAAVPDADTLNLGLTATGSGAFWLGPDLSHSFAAAGMFVVPLSNLVYETAS